MKPEWIDHVVFGNVLQTSSDAIYGARHVALKAGVPIEVPALTVNRLCGSGIQAAVSGAQMIQLGEADIVLTGGIESMSQAPHVIRGLRSGLRLEPGQARGLRSTKRCSIRTAAVHGADGGEVRGEVQHLARGAGRATRCAASRRRRRRGPTGKFTDEVVPVEIKSRKGVTVVDQDDHLRPDTTLEGLAKLPAAFSKDGTRHRRQRERHRRRRRGADSRVGEGREGQGARRRSAASSPGRRSASIRRSWAWGRRRRPARRSRAPG